MIHRTLPYLGGNHLKCYTPNPGDFGMMTEEAVRFLKVPYFFKYIVTYDTSQRFSVQNCCEDDLLKSDPFKLKIFFPE